MEFFVIIIKFAKIVKYLTANFVKVVLRHVISVKIHTIYIKISALQLKLMEHTVMIISNALTVKLLIANYAQ